MTAHRPTGILNGPQAHQRAVILIGDQAFLRTTRRTVVYSVALRRLRPAVALLAQTSPFEVNAVTLPATIVGGVAGNGQWNTSIIPVQVTVLGSPKTAIYGTLQ